MAESLESILQQVTGSRGVVMALVGAGAMFVIWSFVRWGAEPSLIPLYRGLPIETVADVSTRLDDAGIPYQLAQGGTTIEVAASDAVRARVLLAGDGVGVSGRPGFELFDQPSWGMTDFTQRINYRRALEGELERTISKMRGVTSAQVHLALQESSFLRRGERASEASVVLDLGAGTRADEAMVRGITSLVASSVERLVPDDVTVLDNSGYLLTAPSGDGTSSGLSSRQLAIRRDIELYLESKAEVLVSKMVGPRNVSISVAANLNFDQIDRTVQALDPDQQVVTQEDRSEIVPGSAEQGAGSVSTNSQYETSRSVETLSRGGVRIERLSVAVLVNDRQVPNGEGGFTTQPRTAKELTRVESLVRNAVGLEDGRGDAITVVGITFPAPPAPPPVEEASLDIAGVVRASTRPIISITGIIIALMLALRIVGTIRALPPAHPRSVGAGPMPDSAHELPQPEAQAAFIPPPAPVKIEVSDPEMTARVMASWIKDSV